MTVKQISIFLENRQGQLAGICRALAKAEINIATLSLADTADFGIVRMIVDDHVKGVEVLTKAGYAVRETDVVMVTVPDRPGGMAELMEKLDRAGVLKYVAVIAAVVWGLSILGVNTAAVLAGVGILGLILGFGAQSLIEDIITGIFIIFEGQYNIGDIIILDDFRGTVKDIGVRTTVIQDAGGNLKVVNNSDIRNFQNRSKETSIAICEVAVAYETDLYKLRELLEAELPKMLEKHPDIYLAAPKYLGVDALADSGVNLKIAVSTEEKNIFAAKRMLNQDVRMLFMEKGVEIPFPQVVVHKGED